MGFAFITHTLTRSLSATLLLVAAPALQGPTTADEPTGQPETKAQSEPATGQSPKQEAADEEHPARPANRLARESSPYLLMHAHNPIQWYPWSPEAFEAARSQKKPVFLSIGYSSCYWCHVMEREVFSNQKIADYMNEHFICIKVDREERPDVDEIYMTSLIVYQQAAGGGGGGGWPLSMFLDAEGNPIAGATYLPPEDTPDGRVGFLTAAGRIHDLWTNNREALDRTSGMLAREVRRLSGTAVLAEPKELNTQLLKTVADGIYAQYDSIHGGVDFNPRRAEGPRFPNVPRLIFLLDYAARNNNNEMLAAVRHSLDSFARGGIRDHLGGGYHRYSTERTWTIPHFEKMLYDQAQLLEVHARAALLQNTPQDIETIDDLVQFLRREMLLPGGGFCSALDAETNAIEGEYYVWTETEIRELLPDDQEQLFLHTYGFNEPQDFEHGRILFRPANDPAPDAAAAAQLANSRRLLLEARQKRPRPFLDDKVLVEWNALMIQALAVSSQLPGRNADLQLAENAAHFLLQNLRDANGQLLRSWRNGKPGPRAVLDDYACLVSALLELHSVSKAEEWLTAATELMELQIKLFHDPAQKTFFFTAHDHEKLIARTCSPYDSVSPSGNSLTIRNLIRLSRKNPEYLTIARDMLNRFSGTIADSPASCAGMGLAVQDLLAADQSNASTTLPPHWLLHTSQTIAVTMPIPIPLQQQPPQTSTDELKPARSQSPPEDLQNEQGQDKPIRAVIYPLFDKLPRGGKCPVAIQLTIANDWHINANPASPDNLIPTELKLTSPQKVKLTRIKYPEHHEYSPPGTSDLLHVYDGKIIIYAMLETDADELADEAVLNLEINYQACSGEICLPPDRLRLSTRLKTAPADSGIKRINQPMFPQINNPASKQ
jgi:uncharacterized protein YyaL (SSP411 family)